MEDSQEPVGSERSKKKTFTALTVIDELAFHGTVHSVRTISQFANRELRPVLTVAIGQDAVIRNWAVQAYDRIFR